MEWDDFRARVDVQALRAATTEAEFVRILRPGFPEFAHYSDKDLIVGLSRYVPEIVPMLSAQVAHASLHLPAEGRRSITHRVVEQGGNRRTPQLPAVIGQEPDARRGDADRPQEHLQASEANPLIQGRQERMKASKHRLFTYGNFHKLKVIGVFTAVLIAFFLGWSLIFGVPDVLLNPYYNHPDLSSDQKSFQFYMELLDQLNAKEPGGEAWIVAFREANELRLGMEAKTRQWFWSDFYKVIALVGLCYTLCYAFFYFMLRYGTDPLGLKR